MKGVEAVIAIILILMIVIALAALAYTWFSGIFSSLTSTAGGAVTTTTNAMAAQFSIENVKSANLLTYANATIRNTGTQAITGTINAYVNDGVANCNSGCAGVSISPNGFTTVNVTIPACACINKVCTNGGVNEVLALTIGTGLQQAATVTC